MPFLLKTAFLLIVKNYFHFFVNSHLRIFFLLILEIVEGRVGGEKGKRDRDRAREKETEMLVRNTDQLPPTCCLLGIEPAKPICSQTRMEQGGIFWCMDDAQPAEPHPSGLFHAFFAKNMPCFLFLYFAYLSEFV